jgi:CHAT domain-containing protein/tetratricopeptide (TPR) repeat protein
MTALEPGKSIRRELGGGKSHLYCVLVSQGEYFQVAVAQLGVDLEVSVFRPDGSKVVESNHPGGALQEEIVAWVAESSGTYVLNVRSVEIAARAGPYTITLEQLRKATPEDESRIAGRLTLSEAESLFEEGTSESRHRALGKDQEALALWQQLNDAREQSTCLIAIGQVLDALGQLRPALEYHQRALALSRAASDKLGQAAAVTLIGTVHVHMGESSQAIEDFLEAMALWRDVGYRGGEAQALTGLGAVYTTAGERRKALEYYGQALPLLESVGDREGQAATLTGMGLAYDWLGDPQKALDFSSRSLELIRTLGYPALQAVALNNLSLIYNELGEHEKALELLTEALRLRREAGDRRGEAYTLTSIGRTYDFLGRRAEALEHFAQALPLRRAVGDKRGEGTTLKFLGMAHASLGQSQEALKDFTEALTLFRATGDRAEESDALLNIGVLYASLKEREKAVETLAKALELRRATANPRGEALILYQIARVAEDRGDLSEARARLEDALTIIESLRTRLGSPELRSSYLATAQEAFGFAVELWMRSHEKSPGEGFDKGAFAWNERARARSMLELLAQAHVNVREGVAPALLEQERSLQQRLSSQVEKRMRLLSGSHTDEQAEATNREAEGLKTELSEVEARIRATGPRYAALTQPQPLQLSQIQQELDSDTVLLEYALGKERSFLWAVTRTSITSHELPGRLEVETAARRVYDLLTERNRRSPETQQRLARIRDADEGYAEAAGALTRILLNPLRGALGGKRLLIVADGALQYLPFAALPDPETVGERAWTPLVVSHEIVNLPSASVLAVLRGELDGRAQAPKTLAVFADPVFDAQDERLAGSTRNKAVRHPAIGEMDWERDLFRSAAEAGVTSGGETRIPRLRFTRREAQAILQLAPAASRKEALDFDANRETATSPELSQYRFVHFATHGFIDSVHPELSGIVLSLVDRSGRPLPGFLPAGEVFNLKLPADLVVLSGCRTALGKEIRGEGFVGLTRAFLYAGAARVIASLWKVEDRATAELMSRLYGGILSGEKLRPAAALRAAQISMWKQKQWQAPYYWSGFVLQGEWRGEPGTLKTAQTER